MVISQSTTYVKEYTCNYDTFTIFQYISTPVISNNLHLKVNFLGPENLLLDISSLRPGPIVQN